jgi:nitrite reductase/ring-hydroxylating ferredoxin subunit
MGQAPKGRPAARGLKRSTCTEEQMEQRRCSRREFIVLSAGTIVVAACGTGSGPAGGDVTVGNVSDLAVGSSRVASDSSCVVVRDSLGVYAMTLTCTHAGCNMANGVGGSQIFCSCHGSAFGLSGAVIAGPARQALDHLAVSVDASGVITVHTGQTVTADTRVTI